MSIEAPPSAAVGNPVQRATLLRSMRSNVIAAILTGWTVLVATVGAVALGTRVGFSRPFESSRVIATRAGIEVGQWWEITVVAGMCVLMVLLGCTTAAAHGERRRLATWNATLVRPGRAVLGLWTGQLAIGALSLLLALPVAGMALGFGGPTVTQLAIGLAGAAVAGATASAFGLALSIRSRGVLRPLVTGLIVVLAVFAGPSIVHQLRGAPAPDPGLTVVPVVAVADASIPHGPSSICATIETSGPSCVEPPMTRMYASVEPASGPIPPWSWALIGAVVVTVASLLVARFRLARPPRL